MANRHVSLIDDKKEWHEFMNEYCVKKDLASQLSLFYSCEEGLKSIKNSIFPDVILLDISFNQSKTAMGGIECLKQIKKINKNIIVIMFTGSSEAFFIKQALKAKANGYVNKGISIDDLETAIRLAENGHFYLYDDNIKRCWKNYLQEGKEVITKCEIQVLELISQGYDTNQIAEKKINSKHTIDSHRRNLLFKLGAKNSAELIRIGFERGYLRCNYDNN